jgi:hypothetical protein
MAAGDAKYKSESAIPTVVFDSSIAATGKTFIPIVLIVGTITAAPTAEIATVAMPAHTIFTTGGCQLLPLLCFMISSPFPSRR